MAGDLVVAVASARVGKTGPFLDDVEDEHAAEQDYGVPYTNLVKFAKEWAANNVRAVQLVGWNIGGQDGGDPSQDTEPDWALGSNSTMQLPRCRAWA